jgi:Ca2+-binding RTX toxin-like protein
MRSRTSRAATLIAATVIATWVLTAVPASAAPTCFGQAATIVGTSRADRLRGTSGRDVIVGRGGVDVIRGEAGNDLICGGGGSDLLIGDDGRDQLDGGGGSDGLNPGPGNDVVRGGGSAFDDVRYPNATGPIDGSLVDGVVTGMGSDTIESGVEQIVGGPFDDVIEGDDGFNILVGLAGNDTISALDGGFDGLVGGEGDDHLDGGAGFDFVENYFRDAFMSPEILAGPVVVNLVAGTSTGNGSDVLVAVEGVSGSLGDDVMTGNAEDNEFTGLYEGSDTVDAGDGDDVVDGGVGADDLDGGGGVDLLGFLHSPAGITVDLSASTDSEGDTFANFEDVLGTFGDDSITGNDSANFIGGVGGNDSLFGLGGDDGLFGGGGNDTADGGLGTDECVAETETACEADPPPPMALERLRARAYFLKS